MFLMGMVVGACTSMVLVALWDWYKLNREKEEWSYINNPLEKKSSDLDDKLAKEMAESFMKGEWTVTHTPEEYVPHMPFNEEVAVQVAYATCEEHYPHLKMTWWRTAAKGAKFLEGAHFLYEDCLYGGGWVAISSSITEDHKALYTSRVNHMFIEHLKRMMYTEREQKKMDVVSKYLKEKK